MNTVGELDVVLVVEDVVSVDVVGVGVEVGVGVGVDEVVSVGVEEVLVVVSLLGVGDGVVEVVSDVDVEVSVLLVGVAPGLSAGVDMAPPFDSDIVTGLKVPHDPYLRDRFPAQESYGEVSPRTMNTVRRSNGRDETQLAALREHGRSRVRRSRPAGN